LIAADEHLGRGYADFFLLLGKEWGLIFQGTLEGQETIGQAGKGVGGIFHWLQMVGLEETRQCPDWLAPTGH
jgi:hypothetical protein